MECLKWELDSWCAEVVEIVDWAKYWMRGQDYHGKMRQGCAHWQDGRILEIAVTVRSKDCGDLYSRAPPMATPALFYSI